MNFNRFAKFCVLLFLLSLGLTGAARAQNNNPIAAGTFYEDRTLNGSTSTQVTATFAQTPANKYLTITNVACTISVSPNQSVSEVYLVVGTSSGSLDLNRPYPIKGNATPETSGTLKYYSIVHDISFKVGPGRYPSVVVYTSSSGSSSTSAQCVIVGNLADNP